MNKLTFVWARWQNRPIDRFNGPRRSTRKEERASRLRMHATDRFRSIKSPQVSHFFRVDTREPLLGGFSRMEKRGDGGLCSRDVAPRKTGWTKARSVDQRADEEIAGDTCTTVKRVARPPKDCGGRKGCPAIYTLERVLKLGACARSKFLSSEQL